jgi:hypothetical protein
MHYLYHRVPKEMNGHILYPLNQLKAISPDTYAQQIKKYEDRPGVLQRNIPALNCLWNDVLHLTAVHPTVLNEAFISAGKQYNLRFYEIDPEMLEKERMIVYLYDRPSFGSDHIPEDEWERFETSQLPRYSVIPQFTLGYYRDTIALGKEPLLFVRIPHILYKGTLDVRGLKIVT